MYILKTLVLSGWLAALATAQQRVFQGFNSGATLDSTKVKSQSDFEAEFKTAQALQGSPGSFNSVRLYTCVQSGTTSDPIAAFAAALATNTSMLLGIWCSGTNSITNELTALKAAISKHGQQFADLVVGISVGSEDLYRVSESGIENNAGVGQGPKKIVEFINTVRTTIKDTPLADKPIGHVDAWSAWSNKSNIAVIDAVDFVGTDLYPYYEKDKGNQFSNATTIFSYIYNKTLSAAGDKPVWITETGWPFSGPVFGQAEATQQNAATYWQEIGCNQLFGRVNVWWYNLRDSNPDNKEKFAITDNLSTTPRFNLTCAADSGAPAAINTNTKNSGAAKVAGLSLGYVALLGLLGQVYLAL